MNITCLAGKLVGQYELPYANIHAIEIEYEGIEYIVHLSEYMYNQIDLKNMDKIGVKGHLYFFDGRMYIYAEKLYILGA